MNSMKKNVSGGRGHHRNVPKCSFKNNPCIDPSGRAAFLFEKKLSVIKTFETHSNSFDAMGVRLTDSCEFPIIEETFKSVSGWVPN